jgi:Ribbon-helix-helix protein, copG family
MDTARPRLGNSPFWPMNLDIAAPQLPPASTSTGPGAGPGTRPQRNGVTEMYMTDMLIRDVPDDVVAALDAHAGRLGLSRSEYVRRRLAQDAATSSSPVSVADLARFAEVFGDLADPDVISRAWQ